MATSFHKRCHHHRDDKGLHTANRSSLTLCCSTRLNRYTNSTSLKPLASNTIFIAQKRQSNRVCLISSFFSILFTCLFVHVYIFPTHFAFSKVINENVCQESKKLAVGLEVCRFEHEDNKFLANHQQPRLRLFETEEEDIDNHNNNILAFHSHLLLSFQRFILLASTSHYHYHLNTFLPTSFSPIQLIKPPKVISQSNSLFPTIVSVIKFVYVLELH